MELFWAPAWDKFCALCRGRSKQEATGPAAAGRWTWLIPGWTRLVVHSSGSILGSVSVLQTSTSWAHFCAMCAWGRAGLQSSAGAAGLKGAAASKTWLPALARSSAWQEPSCPSGGGFSYSQGLRVQTQEGDDFRSRGQLGMACGCEPVTSLWPSSQMREARSCPLAQQHERSHWALSWTCCNPALLSVSCTW